MEFESIFVWRSGTVHFRSSHVTLMLNFDIIRDAPIAQLFPIPTSGVKEVWAAKPVFLMPIDAEEIIIIML